jgi:hypothetical protein
LVFAGLVITKTFPSTVFSGFSPTPLPCRWDVSGETLTSSVSYGELNATFKGTFSEDGDCFEGGVQTPARTRP